MSKKLYGTVFAKKNTKEVEDFVASIDVDYKLLGYDILGSIAHAKMLGERKIISKKDSQSLVKGLKNILKKMESGKISMTSEGVEDVHTYVNLLLNKEVSKKVADKLHTARSRNDQVVLDTRMYCLDAVQEVALKIIDLQKAILKQAEKNISVIMPVYTHLQPAQAILASHLFCAYVETLQKDKLRMMHAVSNTDEMPLGSCAARGTTLEIDRNFVAKELGFSKVSSNSIESVSSRDYILEILSAINILAINLSRIAEDLIIYSTYEFSFIEIDEAYLTGSSMMPNKRNADTLELVRGFASKALGALTQVSGLLKGLPHAYNRDMQFDKEALFESLEGIIACLKIIEGVFNSLKFNKKKLEIYLAENDFIFATDLAEYLVKKGVSYRDAHDITGKMIRFCLDKKLMIKDISDTELKKICKYFNKKVLDKLTDASSSVKAVKSEGGTSPVSVKKQIGHWRKVLK
ncbi:MAG: argininosuccinate lyase [Candidatus Omnitrophica bacterium]|nr:argininosuccinate lyase [Candidatus Omnitrophota bacterium]